MITITEYGYNIQVTTAMEPGVTYARTVDNLIKLIQDQDQDEPADNFYVLELLRAMMPDPKSIAVKSDT